MNLQYLIYQHVRRETPYQRYIKQKRQAQEKKQKLKFNHQILVFNQKRYPQQLMNQLQKQINPFELSLDKLKQFYNSKFQQYSNELVHDAVDYVFKRKCLQSTMIKESLMVIQNGDESIRNGRKLMKQDFSYFHQNTGKNESAFETSRLIEKQRNLSAQAQKQSAARGPNDIQTITSKFNEMLQEQINREKNKFQNMKIIEEGDQRDVVIDKGSTSRRDKGSTSHRDPGSQSFPVFRETDVLGKPESLQTGRSQIEQLYFLLGSLTIRGEEEEEIQDFTARSRGSSYVKINKQVMENLYNARGKLKLPLVRRVIDKMKNNKNF